MWVWWVLLEEYVGMVGRSLDDLLLVCLGFDGGGPGKGEEGRVCILVFGERKGQSIMKEFW